MFERKHKPISPVVLDPKPDWDYRVKYMPPEGWPLFGFHAPTFRLGLQPPDEESHAQEGTEAR